MEFRKANYPGSAALAAITLVIAACGSGGRGGDLPPPAANTAPVISAITDRSGAQDSTIGPIGFGIGDRESDVAVLTLAVTTDGGGVFPVDGVAVAGSGASRTLTLTPLEAATGAANVTVTLTDPQGLTATRTFRVAVTARDASMRGAALTTFGKGEADEATVVNGYTFAQDADDPAIFEPLIGTE